MNEFDKTNKHFKHKNNFFIVTEASAKISSRKRNGKLFGITTGAAGNNLQVRKTLINGLPVFICLLL